MKWRVRIFEYCLSKNRYPYPAAAQTGFARARLAPTFDHLPVAVPLKWTLRSAREALRHLEGARCFADHSLDSPPGCSPGRSVRDLVGFYSDAAMGPRGPEATLTLLESDGWARAKLLAAWHAGRPDLIGFSVDAVIGVRPVGEGGSRVLEVEHIAAIHSVDMVSAASSGGRAIDILESNVESNVESNSDGGLPERFIVRSMQISSQEGNSERIRRKGATMKEEIERLLEVLRRTGGEVAGGPLGRLQAMLEAELAKPEVDAGRVLAALADWLSSPDTNLSPETAQEQVHEQINVLRQRISEAVRQQQAAEGLSLLDSKLAGSRLPKPLASLVASRFPFGQPVGDRPISEQAVEAEIHRVREAYAALSPAGRVIETGRVRVLQEPCDKMQTALDRLVGLPAEDSSIPAFRGIREAYVTYTGDEEISGAASNLRIHEEFNTAGFPNALSNSLRRLLLRDYQEQDFGIGLIAQFSSVPDFRTQERIRVGYFGDLPTVDPEAADYDELTAPTDEKASYSVVTFGGLVTVTRKMIINDDLGTVPKIAGRLGRSARRTLAQRVFNLMINNGLIYDSVVWFHSTHGNLGSTALSAAELDGAHRHAEPHREGQRQKAGDRPPCSGGAERTGGAGPAGEREAICRRQLHPQPRAFFIRPLQRARRRLSAAHRHQRLVRLRQQRGGAHGGGRIPPRTAGAGVLPGRQPGLGHGLHQRPHPVQGAPRARSRSHRLSRRLQRSGGLSNDSHRGTENR